ncbi:C2H2 finger domain-containingprotein [Purpureocillium lavendulum]|uniref:C2H2 finger domain-containingprotein n=1 Tax=Purpureocillium lavendulum TaxID=1247861 RepID=A0AB34G4Q5_9HYPO|nr:C2H2 finger domain-containingprotein [Purpureocillium lavendulum]
MRFGTTLGGLCAVLFSLGAVALPADPSIDACCCCDIGRNVISCDSSIKKAECMCAQVVCPANAPTVFDGPPAPTHHARAPLGPFIPPVPTPGPVSVVHHAREPLGPYTPPIPTPGSVSIETPPPPAGTAAPGESGRKPTPLPLSEQEHTMPPKSGVPDSCPSRSELSRCCCCNIAKLEVVCQMKPKGDCFCAAVACPATAKTVDLPLPTCTGH